MNTSAREPSPPSAAQDAVTPAYDCELRDWSLRDIEWGSLRIYGAIYGDTLTTANHPFPDGMRVSTSPLISVEGGVATTKSGTRYLLVAGLGDSQ